MAEKKFELYEYKPSKVAALIFVGLFLITTFIHVFQAYKKKALFLIPLIIGGFFEWIGYISRTISSNNPTSLGLYIMQTLLLLLAPALFAASVYMVLGRLITFTRAESLSPIRTNWLTKIFVFGDVLSFLIQSGGGSLMAKASSQNLGKTIVIIGLVLQILFFGVFMVTSAIFHQRLAVNPTTVSRMAPWQKYMFALYAVSALILVRSIFRIAEFAGGRGGALMKSEVYLYIFDAVLMLLVMVILNLIHPGDIIGRNKDVADSMQLSDSTADLGSAPDAGQRRWK
ncbi:RTA1 like protein-domain-containing protein [Halenospora varia]|nr:RTA1 like protein-domain-containing protein [Halenospora varia]